MILKNRSKPLTALVVLAAGLPFLVSACGSDNPLSSVQDGLCCSQFVVGADLSDADFKLEGQVDGEFRAFAQAGSDLAAIASASLTDVSTACEGMARDVGASAADITEVDSMSGDPAAKTKAWCSLAAATIKSKFKASGDFGAEIGVEFQAPTCRASVSAQAKCEASCNIDGKCSVEGMVSCTGGKLPTVQCTGSCEGTVKAPEISCTGSCSGMCEGSCTANADVAVDCNGRCEGDCTVDGMAGGASGVQADGSCKGKCKGTCTASGQAKVACQGTCSGTCDASCTASPGQAKFECNGNCTKTDGTPPKCEGSAELDCDVSADCKANCQASVSAKAECTPPRVAVVLKGEVKAEARAQLDIAVASIETNFPELLVVLKARGESFTAAIQATVKAGGSLSADADQFSGEAALCLIPIAAAITSASANFKAAFDGAGSVSGSLSTG